MTRLILPWPPSANNSKVPLITKSKKTGKRILRQISSAQLRKYTEEVVLLARLTGAPRICGVVSVRIDVYEPDNHRRDIANLEKAPIDALVKAGVIEDDCLIDDLRIVRHRGQATKGGMLHVTIEGVSRNEPED